MSNKDLFRAGLFCLKESVFNVLSEHSQLDHAEISAILEIEKSYQDSASYSLLRGILDELSRDDRVERVDTGKKMIWRIK